MKTIKKDESEELLSKWWKAIGGEIIEDIANSVKDDKDESDEYCAFNEKARERFIRNILCELKSEIESQFDEFGVGFERLGSFNNGFAYKFVILPKNMDGFTVNKDAMEKYDGLIDYAYKMLKFLSSDSIQMVINPKLDSAKEIIINVLN